MGANMVGGLERRLAGSWLWDRRRGGYISFAKTLFTAQISRMIDSSDWSGADLNDLGMSKGTRNKNHYYFRVLEYSDGSNNIINMI